MLSHFHFFAFTTCLLFAHLLIPAVNCDEGGGEEEPEVEAEAVPEEQNCKKSIFNFAQGQINASLNCLGGKLVLRNPLELTSRFYCIVKCAMMELEVIDESGHLDDVSALFYFQGVVHPSVRDTVTAGSQPCLAMASAFNPSEYYCQSYAGFTQCVIRNLFRTYFPFVMDCFGSPGLSFFFSFIDLMVPRVYPSSSSLQAINEVGKRIADEDQQRLLQQRRRQQRPNNTLGINATRLLASPAKNSRKIKNSTKSSSTSSSLLVKSSVDSGEGKN